MFKLCDSDRRAFGFCAAVILAVCASSVGAGVGVSSSKDPQTTLLQDVQSVLAQDVPVGIVLGDGDGFDMTLSTAGAPASTSGPARLIQGFSARWGKLFEITNTKRGLDAVSRRSGACRVALSRVVPEHAFVGSPHEILSTLMTDLSPELRRLPPPGIVSGGGNDETLEKGSAVLSQTLTVVTGAGPLRDALDRAVNAGSQLGWYALEHCDANGRCSCRIGLVTPTTVVHTTYDASPR